MAFKMKGAPMIDTSSKHGTNANFKKSGAPFFGGLVKKAMDPLGLFGGRKGRGRAAACPPAGATPPPTAPPATPAEPAAGAPAPVAAAPEQAAPTTMNKKSKVGAPKLKGKQHKIDKNKDGKISKADFDMMKPGAPMAKPKSGPKMMAKKGGPKMMAKKKGAPMNASPIKGKFLDAIKKGDFKGAGKTLKHEIKGIGAGVKESLKDNYNTRSNANDITSAYRTAKNKSARDQKVKDTKGTKGKTGKKNKEGLYVDAKGKPYTNKKK